MLDAFARYLSERDWTVSADVDFCDLVAHRESERLFVEAWVRAAHDEFMSELESLNYSENAKRTYDKTIDVFMRWLEGGWAPGGPRT